MPALRHPAPAATPGIRRPFAALAHAERLWAAALSLLFTWAFFLEYLPPFKRVHLWSDIAGYHYPLHAYAFQALKNGRIPLWDSTIYCGISFIGNVQAAFFYPPTWLMYALSSRQPRLPFKALEIFAFFHVWLAFLLCYLWLRRRTGKLAAGLGSAIFAFSGYMSYQLLHSGVACAMAWIPLGLWGIDEAVDRRNWRPLWKVAVASTLCFLAGYPAAWLVYCILTAVYALAGRDRWRAAAGVCLALAASFLLSMVQMLPAMEARSLMLQEPKYGPGAWSFRTLFLSYFVPNWFDFNPGHPTDYEPGCIYLYVGLPALFAILWILRRHTLRPYLQPLAALSVALILANPPAFLLSAVELIPALENTMQPFNFYAAAAAMAALIAALGLESFLQARKPTARTVPHWAAFASIAMLAAWSLYQLRISLRGGAFPSHGRALAATALALAIFSLGLWSFRIAAGRLRTVLAAMLLLTAGVDYKAYSSARWFNALPGDVDDEHPAHGIRGLSDAAYRELTSNRLWRIACDEGASPYPTDLRFWGLTTPQGFDPFLPVQYRARIERWVKFRTNRLFFIDFKNEEMLQALGVRYVITHEGAGSQPFLAASPNYHLVGDTTSYYCVYEYLHARPPFHWDGPVRNATAQPVAWYPERREFSVQSETGGRFILAEQFFPGWKASIDGHPVTIERWNGAFQAIAVPPGPHRLTFEFTPAGLKIGAAVSLLALAALFF